MTTAFGIVPALHGKNNAVPAAKAAKHSQKICTPSLYSLKRAAVLRYGGAAFYRAGITPELIVPSAVRAIKHGAPLTAYAAQKYVLCVNKQLGVDKTPPDKYYS